MNIALRYVKGTGRQPWRDTMLRLTGGVVYSLQRTFLVDWYFVDRTLITDRSYYPALTGVSNNCIAQVVTSGPTSSYPEIMQGFVRTILAARRYLYIETPYFLPNDPVLFALKTAALGGVDVRIICPKHSDAYFADWASRSYLRELHHAGAHIYLYHAGFIHSKLIVCDDSLSSCGSTNVDFRSFENNFEANVFIYDEGTALRMKKIFLDDQSMSTPLHEIPQRLNPRFIKRLGESVIRLVSPLL
jgi:cardiolipin synthase